MRKNVKELVKVGLWVAEQYGRSLLGLFSEWHQDVYVDKWPCGTICCVAGRVALESDYKHFNSDIFLAPGFEFPAKPDGPDEQTVWWNAYYVAAGEGNILSAADIAQEILGLNIEERYMLFNGSNGFDDVMSAIKTFIDQQVEADAGQILEILTDMTQDEAKRLVRRSYGL